MQSPNWIPFYDDGRVVMFGRADAAEPDLAAFKNNRLEPDLRAYRVAPSRFPRPIARRRRPRGSTSSSRTGCLGRPQSHTNAAGRWLQAATPRMRPSPACPTPRGVCWRSARRVPLWPRTPTTGSPTACSTSPTAPLMLQETALLAGIPLDSGERVANCDAGPQHRSAQYPVPTAGHGPQLCDPDHAPHPHTRGPARARLAQPGIVPALSPGRLSRPGPRPASGGPGSDSSRGISLPRSRPSTISSSSSSTSVSIRLRKP